MGRELTKNNNQLFEIANHVPGMIYQLRLYPDGRFCFPYTGPTIQNIYGLKSEEVALDGTPLANRIHPDDIANVWEAVFKSRDQLKECVCEFRVLAPNQEPKWVMGHSRPQKLDDGSFLWNGVFTDISMRINAENEVRKTSRLYAVTAQINQMVIHSKSHHEVFSQACRIATEVGEFRMAWIGRINGNKHAIEPIIYSGHEDGYLHHINISTLESSPEGSGPTGTTVREKKTIINNDIENNPSFAPWREEALKRDYRSSIALPIICKETVIGTFNLYATTPNFFNQTEVELLESIAQNISYAIESIEGKRMHQIAEQALKESEFKFRMMFEKSPLGIAIINSKSGKFEKVNPTYLNIVGRTEDEVKNLDWMSITHPDDVIEGKQTETEMKNKGIDGLKLTKRYYRPDKSIVWAEVSVVPFQDTAGQRNLCIVEDITERKLSVDKLKKSEEDLKLALAIRDQFISIASHELKTPLTSLKLQLQMMYRDLRNEERPCCVSAAKSLELSNRQVDRMNDLIENLLNVARINSGKLDLKLEEFDLSEVLNECLEKFKALFQESECEVICKVDTKLYGKWDRSRIEQVFSNLLSNAIKYAPKKPISITLAKENDVITLTVRDHGPGIPTEKQSVIFDRFVRATNENNISGLGLGLYITKQIVEAHKGTIEVNNEDKGASFRVKLPVA